MTIVFTCKMTRLVVLRIGALKGSSENYSLFNEEHVCTSCLTDSLANPTSPHVVLQCGTGAAFAATCRGFLAVGSLLRIRGHLSFALS